MTLFTDLLGQGAAIPLLVGFLLLLGGGETLVRGAVRVAEGLRVSPLLIGLTLVGFGTSTPELAASLSAALAGSPGIAVGNVVGSNICNILLILGLAALIRPVATEPTSLRRDGIALALATFAGAAALAGGVMGLAAGLAFLGGLAVYLVIAAREERRSPENLAVAELVAAAPVSRGAMFGALALAVGGIALVVLGGGAMVTGATRLARDMGVSEAVIGLTVVAVGTSLPELVASCLAAVRGRSDIAFGNVVGSNIFNILGILGATAAVTPLQAPASIIGLDLWVMGGATALLLIFSRTGLRIGRAEGAVFLAGYGGYCGWLAAGAF